MLRIRLKRFGKIHRPFYRIVLAEHSQAVNGKYLVKIGDYDPFTKKINLDKNLATDWMNKGAKPSNTVAKLFVREGLKHKAIVIKTFNGKSKSKKAPTPQQNIAGAGSQAENVGKKDTEKQQKLVKKEATKVEFEAKKETKTKVKNKEIAAEKPTQKPVEASKK